MLLSKQVGCVGRRQEPRIGRQAATVPCSSLARVQNHKLYQPLAQQRRLLESVRLSRCVAKASPQTSVAGKSPAVTTQPNLYTAPLPPRNILVAIDDSVDSEFACAWATQNIYRKGDTVHLVHCVPALQGERVHMLPTGRPVYTPTNVTVLEEQIMLDRKRWAAERFGENMKTSGAPFDVHIIKETLGTGKSGIGESILAKAQELEAAVVVIASHSAGGLTEFIMGSVANYLVHHCEQPVAVLHAPKRPWTWSDTLESVDWDESGMGLDDVGRPEGQPEERRTRHVVIAVDESDDSLQSCQWALDHIYRQGDVFHLTHVIPAIPPQMYYSMSPDGTVTALPTPEEESHQEERHWEEAVKSRFTAIMEAAGVPFQFEIMYCEDVQDNDHVRSVSVSLCHLAEKLDAAALVMTSHAKTALMEFLMGSVANYCAHKCRQPVVVLHGHNSV